jgi:hypothetical protein
VAGSMAALWQRASDSLPDILPLMQKHPSRAAVCILRVEKEPRGLLITMTVNRDVARDAAEPPIFFADADEAAAAVAALLHSLARYDQP